MNKAVRGACLSAMAGNTMVSWTMIDPAHDAARINVPAPAVREEIDTDVAAVRVAAGRGA